MPVEDQLPPGETVYLRGCPWYVVPRKQGDGSHVLWDGQNRAYVAKRGSVRDAVIELERLRRVTHE